MRTLLFTLLAVLSINAYGEDLQGYIISNSGDTTKGIIDVTVGKTGYFNKEAEIIFAALETQIKFSDGSTKKKKLDENDIKGFGFTYNNEWYHFIFLDLKKVNLKRGESLFSKFFVRRVDEGYLTLYKHYYMTDVQRYRSNVYANHPNHGFIDVAIRGRMYEFKDFLSQVLKLEDEFVKTVDKKKDFGYAEDVLKAYNVWKKDKK